MMSHLVVCTYHWGRQGGPFDARLTASHPTPYPSPHNIIANTNGPTHHTIKHHATPTGVDTTLDPLPYAIARWVPGGWPAVEAAGRLFNTLTVKDGWGRPVLLFKNQFALTQVEADAADKLGALSPFALPPDT